jgi:hypothetical protein
MAEDRITFVPKSVALECPTCGEIVAATVVGHYAFFAEGPDIPIRYLFTRCPSCDDPMVARQENDGNWNDDRDFSQPVRALPAPFQAGPAVPPSVATAYEEAARCFTVRAYAATALMCRKALEALIGEHKISAGNLADALKAMRDQGLIEARLFEWADALRLTGNTAAHDVSENISREDARDVLDFTSAIMEYVFTFRDRFETFKERRAKHKKAAT